MARLTRVKDRYECRIDECFAEEWMESLYNTLTYENICKECPFIKYINKLADYEDKEEEGDN